MVLDDLRGGGEEGLVGAPAHQRVAVVGGRGGVAHEARRHVAAAGKARVERLEKAKTFKGRTQAGAHLSAPLIKVIFGFKVHFVAVSNLEFFIQVTSNPAIRLTHFLVKYPWTKHRLHKMFSGRLRCFTFVKL